MRVAEFKQLVREAQSGGLLDDQWDTVARHPDLWELRWRWGGDEVRGYFHEPDGKWGNCAILARVHVKWISPAPDRATCEQETRVEQNRHIDEAARRIRSEIASEWGLPGTPTVLPT